MNFIFRIGNSMKLTEKQEKALETGKHITLRAGAGSGKTRVLTERYLHILENRKADVDGILALTFTDKAAKEMKDRIRLGIESRLQDSFNNKDIKGIGLWETIKERFDDANISTIHSFCKRILSENSLAGGVDPRFKLIKDIERYIILSNSIENSINVLEKENCDSLRIISEQWSKTAIIGIINVLLRDRYSSMKWSKRVKQSSVGELKSYYKALSVGIVESLMPVDWIQEKIQNIDILECTNETDRQYCMYHSCLNGLKHSLDALRKGELPDLGWADGIKLVGGIKKNWADGDLEAWKGNEKEIRDRVTSAAKYIFSENDSKYVEINIALADVFQRISSDYDQAKGRGVYLDFDDLQIKTLEMLKNNRKTAHMLGSKYKFIMVDEFQDTNLIQWEIINSIVSTENNDFSSRVFIVGDDKQSIYAFRGADVGVFKSVSKLLSDLNDSTDDSNIELDINFRSNKKLLEFFNLFFNDVFNIGLYGSGSVIKYNFINSGRDCESNTENHPNVEMIDVSSYETYSDIYDKYEYEAEFVARRLRQMLDNPQEYPVYDSENNCYRVLEQDDIAVLFPRRTHLREYEEAFKRNKINYLNIGGMNYFKCREIQDLLNLLRYLSDQRNEIALAGVIRSPLIGMSDEQLFRISLKSGETLFDKIKKSMKSGDELSAQVAENITRWIAYSDRMSLSILINRILTETGAWGVYATGGDGKQALLNIEKFISMAREHETIERRSLKSFLESIELKIASDTVESEAQVTDIVDGCIRLMTVHAAKGLEFPVVVVASVDSGYRWYESEGFYIDRIENGNYEVGFNINVVNEELEIKETNMMNELLKDIRRKKAMEEGKRLLYVAATRARDYLIFAGCSNDEDRKSEIINSWNHEIGTYVYPELDGKYNGIVFWNEEIPVGIQSKKNKMDMDYGYYEDVLTKFDMGSGYLNERLKYMQNTKMAQGIDLSVTDIQLYVNNKDEFIETRLKGISNELKREKKRIIENNKSDEISPVLRGTIVHRLFEEYVSNPDEDVKKILDKIYFDMNINNLCHKREIEKKYISKIREFRSSEIWKKMKGKQKVTELPFLLGIGANRIRGQIDLIFNDDGIWHIIDYKTDIIDKEQMHNKSDRYSYQMGIYALAASKGLKVVDRIKTSIYFVEHDSVVNSTVERTCSGLKKFESELTRLIDEIRELNVSIK